MQRTSRLMFYQLYADFATISRGLHGFAVSFSFTTVLGSTIKLSCKRRMYMVLCFNIHNGTFAIAERNKINIFPIKSKEILKNL